MADYPQAKCPRCGQLVDASGEVSIDGQPPLPSYECEAPTCTRPFEFDGEVTSAPFTFIVTADGRAVEVPIED